MFTVQQTTDHPKQEASEICIEWNVDFVIHYIVPMSVSLISENKE